MSSDPMVQAVSRLATWLTAMRAPDGYSGPVAHWWQQSLQYTGAGFDWRYEGIITGYLHLYHATHNPHWLQRATHAADDIVQAQLPDARLPNSSFEQNPYPSGTPHEAAAMLALLRLAHTLHQQSDLRWQTYLAVAGRNLWQQQIARLWDARARAFRDALDVPSFVPNKAATLAQALLLLAQLTHDEQLITHYALPTLDTVLAHQVQGGALDGAIYQNSFGQRRVPKFFPYYIARCIPALLAGYAVSGVPRYLAGAQRALDFVLRWRNPDGSLPQVIYAGGRVNRYPCWIAATGDIIMAIQALQPYGSTADPDPTLHWLLQGQLPTGGFRTAHGFAAHITQRTPSDLPEFRDLLPVCGWNDKAFACLTSMLEPAAAQHVTDTLTLPACELACQFRGQPMVYQEDAQQIVLRQGQHTHYQWQKGAAWPHVCTPLMYLK